MVRRIMQFSMAIWWLTWVLVVIPCHTRGILPMGGCAECNDASPLFMGTFARVCCVSKDSTQPTDRPSAPKSSSNCALCNLAATTPAAPPVAPLIEFLNFQETLALSTPESHDAIHVPTPRASRAPPSC